MKEWTIYKNEDKFFLAAESNDPEVKSILDNCEVVTSFQAASVAEANKKKDEFLGLIVEEDSPEE